MLLLESYLLSQQIQRTLKFTAGVLVAFLRGGFDALTVDFAGLVSAAEPLQGLAAVEVGVSIGGIVRDERAELSDCILQARQLHVFHCQTVAGEAVRGVLRKQVLKDLQAAAHNGYANIPAMACPYFYPRERFEDRAWVKPPRLPLGDPHTGVCRVDPMREWMPDSETLKECCNIGYARQRCSRFPEGDGPDAMRFSVVTDADAVLKIFFVAEHDHEPSEHGNLECSADSGKFLGGSANELIQAQAEAYAASYIRRKRQPEETARNPHRR